MVLLALMVLGNQLMAQSSGELDEAILQNRGMEIFMMSVDSSYMEDDMIYHQAHMDWPTMEYTSILMSWEESFNCTYYSGKKAYRKHVRELVKEDIIDSYDKNFDGRIINYCECLNDRFNYFAWEWEDGLTFSIVSFTKEL